MNPFAIVAIVVLALLIAWLVASTLRGMAQCASPEGSDNCMECAVAGKPGPSGRI